MFITVKTRKYLVLVMGLMFLVGIAETARATTCTIEEVCKKVGDGKDASGSMTGAAKDIIYKSCDGDVTSSQCSIHTVIDLCLSNDTSALANCSN